MLVNVYVFSELCLVALETRISAMKELKSFLYFVKRHWHTLYLDSNQDINGVIPSLSELFISLAVCYFPSLCWYFIFLRNFLKYLILDYETLVGMLAFLYDRNNRFKIVMNGYQALKNNEIRKFIWDKQVDN